MKILSKIKKTENAESAQTVKQEGVLSKLKKKMTKKRITAIVCSLLAVLIIGSRVIAANAAQPVQTAKVESKSMVKELEISGKLRSNSKVTVYSDVECKVGKINVSNGEKAIKGTPVIEYDKTDMEYRLQKARLNQLSVEKGYDDKVASDGKVAGLYSQASTNLKTLDEQILLYQAAIAQLDYDIERKEAALASEGANLQISLIEWADDPTSEEYENLEKLVQRNSYEQGHNTELVQMKQTRACYQDNLSECKQQKAEMTSQKNSSYTSMMTTSGKEKLEADRESDEIDSAIKVSNLESVSDGVAHDFDGIVTNVAVKEGSIVTVGQEMYTIESVDDLVVYARVNKYDIGELAIGQSVRIKINNKEYTGKVSKIEQAVTEDSKGVPGVGVEITPDNPDEGFIIGLDAKAYILTMSEENVLQIPSAAVCSDSEGEYVYVYRDGKAVKVSVVVGISNGTNIQILEGLTEADEVIVNEDANVEITDGMEVKSADNKDAKGDK